jgi:hypothetical protein
MPLTLRGRAALFALFAIFLIPIGMSSLRGLTQVVTCSERAAAPFTLEIAEGRPPVVVTSSRVEAGEPTGLCGGLAVDLRARAESATDMTMVIVVSNTTKAFWRGTVQLVIGQTSYPVSIGRIQPGSSAGAEVEHHLPAGTHELSGSLLIGP